ncbi:Zinc-type alcohol dehydrogenase-like protein [Phytophthora ramorum]|uniref:Zinc-type alcohol dehydrogenase-like protein n=1 Tax=Phytophthora ramorum TaxID=164328 RepID=UPI0030A34607|nr:Zinc-type alcohol dehydrogenase-like protein [Phytophthora ramorum]
MSPPPTMKNAVYRFGDRTSYKTIKQTTESVPAVRDHEVLVEIHGVTLNYRDLAISKSEYPSTVTEHVVPCSDGAGVVVSVGSAVEDIDVGDRVITNFDVTNLYGPVLNGGSHRLGGVLDGMLRQYAAVPAQAVIKIPEECTLDFVQLASLVCADAVRDVHDAGLVLAKVSALVLDIDYVLTESKRPSVHPIHAEIVAWPSAQPYTLAALFSYSALLVHVQDVHQNLCKSLKGNADGSAVDSKVLLDSIFGGGSTRSSLMSSALYLCALLSKSISILLPAGFFLVDLWVYRTLLLISTSVLTHWRNEDSLYEFSLRADPADWKILGQRAEYLLHAERCASNGAECRHLWILANEFSPRGTLKSQLYRLHLLVVLGDAVHACDGYLSLLKDNPDNSSVHNNAAVCFAVRGKLTEARREFSRALQTPTIKDTMATHTKNSRTFDEWEAQHALHSADEWPGFVGTLTY